MTRDFSFPHAYKVLIAMRYIFSIVLIGIPWFVYGCLGIIYNIVWNSWLNKGWAEGNLWLLGNTYYVLIQTFLSFLLYFEFFPYLNWFALIRFFSVGCAFVYNWFYIFFLIMWLTEVYWIPFQDEEEAEKMGALDIFMNMFFVYNSVLHAPVYVVNCAIMFKEFLLLAWSLITSDPINSESRYALNW